MIKKDLLKNRVQLAAFFTAAGLAFAICCHISTYAYTAKEADSPVPSQKTQAQLNGYSEEAWAALMDNNLNYDEIDDLVKNFNPSVSFAWDNYNKSSEDILTNINDLKSAKKTMEALVDMAKEEKDIENYYVYKGQIAAFNSMILNMNKTRETLAKPINSSNNSIRKAQHQMSSSVKLLMISYKNAEAQEASLNELISLNKSLMSAAEAMLKAGASTNADYIKAKAEVESAAAQLDKLLVSKEQLRRSLIILCGWQPEANPVIGDIPEPDLAHIDAMNPEMDIVKAIGNNYTLIEGRNESIKDSVGSYRAKRLNVEDQEGKLKIKLNELHQKVLSARNACQAAEIAAQSAELNKNAAEVKKKVGAISEPQYMSESLSFIQKNSALKSAKLDLSLAVFEYDDAVAGNVSIDMEGKE
jgi:hypothetical protein